MERHVVISIDAGGTYYKAALVDAADGKAIPETEQEIPSRSNGDRDTILAGVVEAVRRMFAAAELVSGDAVVDKITFDFPGPFDYVNGCAMMEHKFAAIRGEPLAPHIRAALHIDSAIPIVFHHDLHAFTYGACLFDSGRGFDAVFCITLGTGLGCGVFRDGTVVMNHDGSPIYELYKQPWGDGVLEDVVSNRGIVALYERLRAGHDAPSAASSHDQPPAGAKEVAERAADGDADALAAFQEMGRTLGRALAPVLDREAIQALVVGGQIAKSYRLFGPALEAELAACTSLRNVAPITDFRFTSIRGNAAMPLAWYRRYTDAHNDGETGVS